MKILSGPSRKQFKMGAAHWSAKVTGEIATICLKQPAPERPSNIIYTIHIQRVVNN